MSTTEALSSPEEAVPTRLEHSRSLADAERYQALQTLQELGLLVPFDNLETYHGRVSTYEGDPTEWRVKPSYTDSSRQNANVTQTLYTTELAQAGRFAEARRAEETGGVPLRRVFNGGVIRNYVVETHEIAAADPDAMMVDLIDFNEGDLSAADRERYYAALEALRIPLTEGSPLDFADREAMPAFRDVLNRLQRSVVADSEVADIAQETGISLQTARQLIGSYNAYQMIARSPKMLALRMLDHGMEVPTLAGLKVNDETVNLPMNMEYVARWMQLAHVVGIRHEVDSVTLGERIKVNSLIDLDNIGTVPQLAARRQMFQRYLGGLARVFGEQTEPDVAGHTLWQLLYHNPYAKPEALIAAAMEVDGFADVFKGPTGTHEQFTLGEHTETVLRLFDESIADHVPVPLLVPARLAMIVHDIGKPEAVAHGSRSEQKTFNRVWAQDFLTKLGAPDHIQLVVLAMIGDGSELAFKIDIRREGERPLADLRELGRTTLREAYGLAEVPDEYVDGFVELCRVLQMCDGGAYTSMAVTRKDEGGRYRNYPSFNGSFAPPRDLGRRTLRFRDQDGVVAPSRLVPGR